MIGLVMTGNGFPLAHHVFPGNTTDSTTLQTVLADVQERFGIGPVTVVADRGLISQANLDAITTAGCHHILATRLHRSPDTHTALEASRHPDAIWEPAPNAHAAVCETTVNSQRMIVVASIERWIRDTRRGQELRTRIETRLQDLEDRTRARPPAKRDRDKTLAQAHRILNDSPVARCYDIEINRDGVFLWHYNQPAIDYDDLLAGRWVLTTDHPANQLPAPAVLDTYRQLLEVESTFRVLKDLIELRPMRHWTEPRVHGHIAICVYAALIEALIEHDLRTAGIADPDIDGQLITPRRALRELARVHHVTINIGDRTITHTTRRTPLQQQLLNTLAHQT